MKQKTKESILERVWIVLAFLIIFGVYDYLFYSLGFNLSHSWKIALIFTIPTSYLGDICSNLRDIFEQKKELTDALSKIADKLNETKEVDQLLCDELHKQNERDRLNDVKKALNS
jgi:cell shape-determining protein MreC